MNAIINHIEHNLFAPSPDTEGMVDPEIAELLVRIDRLSIEPWKKKDAKRVFQKFLEFHKQNSWKLPRVVDVTLEESPNVSWKVIRPLYGMIDILRLNPTRRLYGYDIPVPWEKRQVFIHLEPPSIRKEELPSASWKVEDLLIK